MFLPIFIIFLPYYNNLKINRFFFFTFDYMMVSHFQHRHEELIFLLKIPFYY